MQHLDSDFAVKIISLIRLNCVPIIHSLPEKNRSVFSASHRSPRNVEVENNDQLSHEAQIRNSIQPHDIGNPSESVSLSLT